MSEKTCDQKTDNDYLVCTCMGVMHSDICCAIKQGNRDFKSLSDALGVGTGCSSCVAEVEEILERECKKSEI
jgi:bacterioferritin-associated ferredoxin